MSRSLATLRRSVPTACTPCQEPPCTCNPQPRSAPASRRIRDARSILPACPAGARRARRIRDLRARPPPRCLAPPNLAHPPRRCAYVMPCLCAPPARRAPIALVVIAIFACARTNVARQTGPRTRAERTNYTETSHHADVLAFLDALDHAAPGKRARRTIGTTSQGRE